MKKKNLNKISSIELLDELQKRCSDESRGTGVLNSTSNRKVLSDLINNPTMKFGIVLTYGYPSDVNVKNHKCRECGEIKDSSHFTYYLSRVDQDGNLMRSNAICDECSKGLNKKRSYVLKFENKNGIIPDKPKYGDICPDCGRQWFGLWHRHHDDTNKSFVRWECGNCNMKHSDQRTRVC